MANNTHIKVWMSHDGYRDPDDNLSMLVGGAQAQSVDKSNTAVTIAGFVYGDTKDGGQYYMLNPTGQAPKAFGSDFRYGDKAGNKVAAGNYEFYKDYGKEGLRDLSDGKWGQYDLLAQDRGGLRAWNFDATSKAQISAAAAALATDIQQAIAKSSNELVVYSAGGGANVAAEAIGYLYNQGYREAAIEAHFAIVQHGRSNWGNQYEAEARALTRDFTIAISNQNLARYANGMDGPDLKHAIPNPGKIDGRAFGSDFDKALDVAMGQRAYVGLKAGTTFKKTLDASDAGSHAFAVDVGRLLQALDNRMVKGDTLPDGDAWAHRIDGDHGARLRVIYNAFDRTDITNLLDGDFQFASAAPLGGGGAAAAAPADRPEAGGVDAPFATDGPAAGLGGVKLYGFGADGKAAAVAVAGGKLGVADVGDGNEVDRQGSSSEMLALDFGAAVDAITLRLAGLGSKNGADEAALLTAYAADGTELDTWMLRDARARVDFDAAVRYATLEAADWVGGDAPGSEPDFALISLGVDYL